MLTNRFKALEDALYQATLTAPLAAPDVRAAVDRALEQHTARVQYLRDK